MKLIIDIPDEIYKASQILDVKYEDVIQIPLENIKNGKPLEEVIQGIKQEIKETYSGYTICEWFENYDYEENDISEYQPAEYDICDILLTIDKYFER